MLHAYKVFLLSGGRERLLEILDSQLDRLQRRLEFHSRPASPGPKSQPQRRREGEIGPSEAGIDEEGEVGEEVKNAELEGFSETAGERRKRLREILLEQPYRSLIVWCLRTLFRFSQLYGAFSPFFSVTGCIGCC